VRFDIIRYILTDIPTLSVSITAGAADYNSSQYNIDHNG
jgi:hypothetical protein